MRFFYLAVLGASMACTLPPFEYEGEHVVVATDVVGQVCAGTLRSLDRGAEYVDDRLGLERPDEPLRIAILSHDESTRLCTRSSCAKIQNGAPLVVLERMDVLKVMVHETVHARLMLPRPRVALFEEGIAVALAPALCPPTGEPPDLDSLLTANSGKEFGLEDYRVAGELVAWLLAVHGSQRVLDFLRTLSRPEAVAPVSDPEFVRASYRAHFGTELDDDIHAHVRDPALLSPEQLGCVAPPAPVRDDRVHLQANFDCDSPRVETDFRYWNRGFVEWTLEVPQTASPQRYRLLDRLPAETALKVVRCTCEVDVGGERALWDDDSNVGSFVDLEPGTHVVRWEGPLDEDLELDIEIEIDVAE